MGAGRIIPYGNQLSVNLPDVNLTENINSYFLLAGSYLVFEYFEKIIFGSFENYVIVVIVAYVLAGGAWFLSRRVTSPLVRRAVRASIIFWVFPILIPAGHGFIFGQPWVFFLLVAASDWIVSTLSILGIWVAVLIFSTHNIKW